MQPSKTPTPGSLVNRLRAKTESEGDKLAEEMTNRAERPLSQPEEQAVFSQKTAIKKAKKKTEKWVESVEKYTLYIPSTMIEKLDNLLLEERKKAILQPDMKKMPSLNDVILNMIREKLKGSAE
jgi:hypothetical protein